MSFRRFLALAAMLFALLVLGMTAGCKTQETISPFDYDRIKYNLDLNEHIYRLRQHRVYLDGPENNFVIQYYNNHAIYAASLEKDGNEAVEEVVYYKEQWYHVSQEGRVRQKIESEDAINFIRWIYVETNR